MIKIVKIIFIGLCISSFIQRCRFSQRKGKTKELTNLNITAEEARHLERTFRKQRMLKEKNLYSESSLFFFKIIFF